MERLATREKATSEGRLAIDRPFLARLILGALSDHEQRRLVARLLPHDEELRRDLGAALGPFEMFDLDLAREQEASLARGEDAAARRAALLAEAEARAPDLDGLVRRFTFEDVFRLGAATRQLFTWSMAEHLLARGARRGLSDYEVRTSFHLALMVVDVVEILGRSGHAPPLPRLVADLRERIHAAAAAVRSGQDDGRSG